MNPSDEITYYKEKIYRKQVLDKLNVKGNHKNYNEGNLESVSHQKKSHQHSNEDRNRYDKNYGMNHNDNKMIEKVDDLNNIQYQKIHKKSNHMSIPPSQQSVIKNNINN